MLLDYSTQLPASRVLEDRYGANINRMVVPKGQAGRLVYVSEFVEEAKASGLVQKAIDRAGPRGVTVAAPGDPTAQAADPRVADIVRAGELRVAPAGKR